MSGATSSPGQGPEAALQVSRSEPQASEGHRAGDAERSASPRENWEELARAAASRGDGQTPAEVPRQLLCVKVDGASYAVPVESVREIVRVRTITPIPRASNEVCGVISLRGEIIQVIDLRLRLRLAPAASAKANRIVVVHAADDGVAGVLVDEVREVLRVPESAIGSPPAGEAGIVAALCTNGAEFVSIVDPERLLEVGGRA